MSNNLTSSLSNLEMHIDPILGTCISIAQIAKISNVSKDKISSAIPAQFKLKVNMRNSQNSEYSTWVANQEGWFACSQIIKDQNLDNTLTAIFENFNASNQEESIESGGPANYAGPNMVAMFGNCKINYINIDGRLFIKLKDVCGVIEYNNDINKAANLISTEYKVEIIEFVPEANRNCNVVYVEDLGVYEFLNRTRAPKAKEFQRFTQTVLREIHQTGGYNLQQAQPSTDIATMCAAILSAIQSESAKVIALIEAKYNTIDNLVLSNTKIMEMVINTQNTQVKHQLIEDYIIQTTAAKTTTLYTNKTKITVREFVNTLNIDCNCKKISYQLKKLGYKSNHIAKVLVHSM